ncbi:MAG: hypothetical protein H6577_10310 [Lewinellaceae bacterium]|nr:hypothetical protein [Saprospiraceae bacterium]MCB9338509.1 hypothetical protein [Lewinellaceae bacterium]
MLRKIILDNTVFNRFVRLPSVDLFELLRNLDLEQVLVPAEVFKELQDFASSFPSLAPRLNSWLKAIKPNTFFHFCTSIDPIVHAMIYDQVDKGEAHAIAQSAATFSGFFITDDFKFEKKLPPANYYPTCYSSYFLLAYADVNGFLTDDQYSNAFIEMKFDLNITSMNSKNQKELRQRWRTEYTAALRHLSLPFDKKRIQRKVYIR